MLHCQCCRQVSFDVTSRNVASTGAAPRRVIAARICRVPSHPNADSDILQINNMSLNGDETSEGVRMDVRRPFMFLNRRRQSPTPQGKGRSRHSASSSTLVDSPSMVCSPKRSPPFMTTPPGPSFPVEPEPLSAP
jgi:hypothetical protein